MRYEMSKRPKGNISGILRKILLAYPLPASRLRQESSQAKRKLQLFLSRAASPARPLPRHVKWLIV